MAAQPLLLFGTPVWRLSAPERLLTKLPGIAAKIQSDIEAGVFDEFVTRSNFNGYQSPYSLLKDNLYFGAEERSVLIQMIHSVVGLSMNFGITSAINCSPAGSHNTAHVHPNTEIAGVFYIAVPKLSGQLVFRDPRPQCEVTGLHGKFGSAIQSLAPRVPIKPKTGELLLFPGWLMHQVEPGTNHNELRISMAMNVNGLAYA